MFHYLIMQWPRVRAEDQELTVLKVPVQKHEVGDKITYSYPMVTFGFAASVVVGEDGQLIKNAVSGLSKCTDLSGLNSFLKEKAIEYKTDDLLEWRFAMMQKTILGKVIEQYGSLEKYQEVLTQSTSFAYEALLPFFKSQPVKNMNVQGTVTGRFDSSKPNSPNSVNSECVDCNE